jgi:nitric oxide reductase subunit C
LKLRTLLIVGALSFALFIAINLISARLPTPIPERAKQGKQVWQRNNCISCHTLFGNGGYVGDDLTHIVGKKTPSQVAEYLVHPPVMRPNKHTHHPALNAEEARNLVQYFQYIDTIPTLGWPPQGEKVGGGS